MQQTITDEEAWAKDRAAHRTRSTISTATDGGRIEAKVGVVHTHECPAWRMPGGKRYGPCSCGAHAAWEEFIAGGGMTGRPIRNHEDLWEAVAHIAPRVR